MNSGNIHSQQFTGITHFRQDTQRQYLRIDAIDGSVGLSIGTGILSLDDAVIIQQGEHIELRVPPTGVISVYTDFTFVVQMSGSGGGFEDWILGTGYWADLKKWTNTGLWRDGE